MTELLKIQSKSFQGVAVRVQAECISCFVCLFLCITVLTLKPTVRTEEEKTESSLGCKCIEPDVGGKHLSVR